VPLRGRVWRRGSAFVALASILVLSAGTSGSGVQARSATRPVGSPEADSQSWPSPDHDLSNSRFATGSSINARTINRLTESWRTATGPAIPFTGGLATAPIIVAGSVFAENSFGVVVRINLRSGAIVWQSPGHGVSVGPYGVTVAFGKVFAATSSGVVALDETNGRQLWNTTLTQSAAEGVDVQPQVCRAGGDLLDCSGERQLRLRRRGARSR